MTHKLELNDFRARRSVLDPCDFALGSDKPEPPPSDLVSLEAWKEIMALPDDVLIRSTSHQGSWIELLHSLWASWVDSMPKQGILLEAMLDIAEDLDAALFNLMHGYYKQSITAYRNALELITFACVCELYGEAYRWTDWQQGKEDLNFRNNCVRVAAHETVRNLDAIGQHTYGADVSLLPSEQDPGSANKAWVTNLYRRLCEYAHPRGTNGKLWSSTGPVYSAEGMRLSCHAYVETYTVLIITVKIASAHLVVPDNVEFLYEPDNIDKYIPAEFRALCTYYGNTLFYTV